MSVFQWIIDNAETMSMNRLPVVATTTARDGTTRAVSRGNAPWQFDVKVADGIPWSTLRQYISQAEFNNRVTPDTINLAHSGFDWLVKYQGESNYQDFIASWTTGSPIISLNGGTGALLYKLRAGDFVQLGNSGRVYSVAKDVLVTDNEVTLHRPVIDAGGQGQLKVGKDCVWTVRCTNFPRWTLMARNQVSWDGSFTFVEEF